MLRRHTRVLVAAAATAALAAPAAQAGHGQDRFVKEPTAVGSGGAAGTVDALATEAAIDTLRRGGNAVDATVAAAGVLGVTEPYSAGIGGGGFMVIRTPHGKITTIDGREKAPAAMRPDTFIDAGVATSDRFSDARYSGLSAGVPGTVEQWDEALDRYGSMSAAQAAQARHRRRARAASSSTRPSSTRRRPTSTTSTTSRRRPRSTSIPTARRATSAARCATPTSRERTSESPRMARARSTAAGSRARSPTPSRLRRRHPTPITCGWPE